MALRTLRWRQGPATGRPRVQEFLLMDHDVNMHIWQRNGAILVNDDYSSKNVKYMIIYIYVCVKCKLSSHVLILYTCLFTEYNWTVHKLSFSLCLCITYVTSYACICHHVTLFCL
jgi:hypothetical protein